jgi:transcription antitermination factor NusG
MLRWYVAQINAGLDLTVKRSLLREGFDEEGRQVFAPSGRLERKLFGRDRRDVFPGYLFLKLDLEDGFVWQKARRIHGLTRLLPGDGMPGALPEGFVEDLRELSMGGHYDPKSAEELAASYMSHQKVFIKSGPFAGHSGEFVRYRKGSLFVLMALLGGQHEVQILSHQASPCAPREAA